MDEQVSRTDQMSGSVYRLSSESGLPDKHFSKHTAVENVLVAMPLTKIGGRNFHQQNKLVHGHSFPGKKRGKCFDVPLPRKSG